MKTSLCERVPRGRVTSCIFSHCGLFSANVCRHGQCSRQLSAGSRAIYWVHNCQHTFHEHHSTKRHLFFYVRFAAFIHSHLLQLQPIKTVSCQAELSGAPALCTGYFGGTWSHIGGKSQSAFKALCGLCGMVQLQVALKIVVAGRESHYKSLQTHALLGITSVGTAMWQQCPKQWIGAGLLSQQPVAAGNSFTLYLLLAPRLGRQTLLCRLRKSLRCVDAKLRILKDWYVRKRSLRRFRTECRALKHVPQKITATTFALSAII